MSILIRGMNMPKHDDEYVIFTVYGDGGVVYGPLNRHHVRYKNRAIPVPPHGRLIDAAALWVEINKICDRRDAGIITDLTCLQQLLSAVRHAPTIIPAEEGET